MRFKGLDLNLFTVFVALMDTRSTTLAGEALGMSQPATSAALARLREFFGDELLAVKGRRMYPTPFAEALLPKVNECLRSADEALSASGRFQPQSSDRRFRIACSDYVTLAIMGPLVRRLADNAPGLTLNLAMLNEQSADLLRRGEIDLMICPSEYAIHGYQTEHLFDEDFVLAGWSRHPVFAQPLDCDAIFAYSHVAVAPAGSRSTTVGDQQLDVLGYSRTVDIVAPSFTSVPAILEGTLRLAIMHRRLALNMAKRFDLAVAELPFHLRSMRELGQFHGMRTQDEGLMWLIEQIRSCAHPDQPQASA